MRAAPERTFPSRLRLLVLIGLSLVVTTAACSGSDSGSDKTSEFQFTGATSAGQVVPTAERLAAPTFDGELLDGSAFRSRSLAGDIVVINLWGSWCAPCRVETPDLEAVYADVRDEGVQFLGIDVKDERQLAQAFVSDVGARYPSIYDPRGEVALAFRGFPANVVPSTILLDRDGRVAAVYTGAVIQPELRRALDALLQEASTKENGS